MKKLSLLLALALLLTLTACKQKEQEPPTPPELVEEDVLRLEDPRRSSLYLFCGRRCDRIKALLWEADGFVLLYKRLSVEGKYRWPRDKSEVRPLTWQQFDWLMSGLDIEQPKAIKVDTMGKETSGKLNIKCM